MVIGSKSFFDLLEEEETLVSLSKFLKSFWVDAEIFNISSLNLPCILSPNKKPMPLTSLPVNVGTFLTLLPLQDGLKSLYGR